MGPELPEGEILRKAIRWISQQRETTAGRPLAKWIEEAGQKFDLSPKDCDFLLRFFTEAQE